MTASLDRLVVADPPQAWAGAGFRIGPEGRCQVGGVSIDLVGREAGTGIVGWSLAGLPEGSLGGDLDGVPVLGSTPTSGAGGSHPNGVTAIDHVVLLSPDLARTAAAFAALGVDPRRERDGSLGGRPVRQVFYRFGEVILEVVGSPPAATDTVTEEPSTLWGITYVVDDIEASAAYFGDRTAPVKDAVQPGRRITTLRHHELGMSVRTALISARARRPAS